MSQAPTLHHYEIDLNDTDRGVNTHLSLRVARHPSETLRRMWLRILAYCSVYQDNIVFGAGLSDPDAPDIVGSSLTGDTTLWARVGKADAAKMQRVCDQNPHAKVLVMFESPQRMAEFITQAQTVARVSRLELAAVDPELVAQLAENEERRGSATITLAGDHFYVEFAGKNIDGALTRARAT